MTTKIVHPITQDMPLPGHYPCLTMQLNVTRYQSQGLVRATLIVREPSDGIEVRRSILEQCEDTPDATDTLLTMIGQALLDMRWLQQGENR